VLAARLPGQSPWQSLRSLVYPSGVLGKVYGDILVSSDVHASTSLLRNGGGRVQGLDIARPSRVRKDQMKKFLYMSLFVICVFFAATARASTHEFYKGKTVRIVVGFPPGGAFDPWARAIAQHMGKYIPGSPDIIVQNMPGGGSLIAANYVYNVAKPDGLTLGTFSSSLYIEQLVGRKEVRFDWGKFGWIGNPERIDRLFHLRADSPYKNLDDMRRATEPVRCGASGAGTPSHYLPKLVAEALGLKIDVVLGYPGTADINLAIERGEVQCWGGGIEAFFSLEPMRTWAKTGFVRVLAQTGKKRDPKLPDVPTIWELMERHKTAEPTRRLVGVLIGGDELGRPYAVAPGTPADRVKTLREAFMKLLSDPDLLAEAKKRNWGIAPTTGEGLAAIAKEAVAQPPELVERMQKLLGK